METRLVEYMRRSRKRNTEQYKYRVIDGVIDTNIDGGHQLKKCKNRINITVGCRPFAQRFAFVGKESHRDIET